MQTDSDLAEPEDPSRPASHEHWATTIPDTVTPETTEDRHPRAEGEDAAFEALEMEHRSMSAQR